MTDHEHCWHAEDPMRALLGAIAGDSGHDVHVCCHCGLMRMPPRVKPEDLPEGHGPFSIHTRADLAPPATPEPVP